MIPRVAVITPGSFPIPSVRSSSVERAVEQVVPLVSHRMDCVVFGKSAKGWPQKGRIIDVPCERVAYTNSFRYVRAILRRLSVIRPDVVQVENRPRYVLAIRRAMPHIHIWLSLHSTTYISKRVISTRLLRRCLDNTDRILVNSFYLREVLLQRFPTIESKIVVNHLGVNEKQFIACRGVEGREQRARGLEDQRLLGRKIILFVGRLLPMKGIHHVLRVLPSVIAHEPNVMFVVVGSAFYGSNRKTAYVRRLEQLAKPYSNHVRFIPYVPYDQMQYWYNIADVLVVPSAEHEAFGLVNVEAMAAGVPVIATRAGGMKEIIEHEHTGFLVDVYPPQLHRELEGRLLQLLADEALRQRMGWAGAQRVERLFTWQHTANRWADLLEQEVRSR